METRLKVLAGTQLVEGLWHVLKHHVMPMEAPANVALIEEYALSYVYQLDCNSDPFADLGRAVAGYVERWAGNPLGLDPAYQKAAVDEDEGEQEGELNQGESEAQLDQADAPAVPELLRETPPVVEGSVFSF